MPQVHATGVAAGPHAVLQLPPGTGESVVREAVRRRPAVDHGWAGAQEELCAAVASTAGS
ncbi:hypothetical protein [Streptomyces geranii]|uniref:hypothetical protein n=1 Tax=Streptomyces geranii TaxID=2058923 RepID=UPI0018E4F55D|nr:hypothetical protein [Streptomyces geranii]